MVYTSTPGNYIRKSDECHIIIHILTVPVHAPSRYKLFNTIAIIRRRHCRAENHCAGRDHAEIRVVRRHGTRLLYPIGYYIILVSVFV